MSALGETLGDGAPPHTFEFKGKTYKIGLLTRDVKVGMERAYYAQARTKAETPADHERLRVQYLAGLFDYDTPGMGQFMAGVKGIATLISLLCGVPVSEATEIYVAKAAELQPLLLVLIKESSVLWASIDPNAQLARDGR